MYVRLVRFRSLEYVDKLSNEEGVEGSWRDG
jgi:hypothetical protein